MCASGTNRQPRGAALIIAMLVMAVLLMAGTAFLTISSTESQIALNERASIQALLLAEAGIHQAIAKLDADTSVTAIPSTTLGGGTFNVTIASAPGCGATGARTLESTGSVPVAGGQAEVVLRATLDQVAYPYRWALFSTTVRDRSTTWRWRSREVWELQAEENATIDSFDSTLGTYHRDTNKGNAGNIGANADVAVERGSIVSGNVSAGDTTNDLDDKDSRVTVTGIVTESAPIQSFPSVATGATANRSLTVEGPHTLPAGTYHYTSVSVGNNATLATSGEVTIYVTGDVGFDNNSALTISGGPVTIYVSGDVSLGNNVTWGSKPTGESNPATQLQIVTMSSDSATANFSGKQDKDRKKGGNNFTLYGSLYGKSTDIKLGNNTQIYGSIIGRTIAVGNNASVHYDHALSDKQLCTFGKYTILRGTWREVYPAN